MNLLQRVASADIFINLQKKYQKFPKGGDDVKGGAGEGIKM
jgi:hypothetical protein